MKVSVIVANYNHQHFLKQSVESVLNQTHGNLEVIIVDDHSTDGSQDLISELVKLDTRVVKPVLMPKNGGKWNGLNTAIATRASGTLVSAQDADDSCCSQRLERQLEAMSEHGSYHNLCSFVHCRSEEEVTLAQSRQFTGELPTLGHREVLKHVLAGHRVPSIKQYWVGPGLEVHGASALFYKQIWDNGIRFNPPGQGLRITWSEDSDFNIRLTLLLQKTSVLKEPLYCYRRDTGTTGSGESRHDQCL
jgi:glycosyltransferase involved in cell wall biosynthesis